MKTKVLFVCIHNSARSQMAEAFLSYHCSERFEAYSAGIEPGKLNPVVIDVMRERGIDISKNSTKSVFDLFNAGTSFEFVITVCDETNAERCPSFPAVAHRLHWGFPDPSTFTGTADARLRHTREIRDTIEQRVQEWCGAACQK